MICRPRDRENVELRGQELVAEEMALRQIRKARDLTQENMAMLLDIDQASVSKIEKRGDMLLSTLRSYVEAMGGSLKITAQFHEGKAIELMTIGQIGGAAPKAGSLGDELKTKKRRKSPAPTI